MNFFLITLLAMSVVSGASYANSLNCRNAEGTITYTWNDGRAGGPGGPATYTALTTITYRTFDSARVTAKTVTLKWDEKNESEIKVGLGKPTHLGTKWRGPWRLDSKTMELTFTRADGKAFFTAGEHPITGKFESRVRELKDWFICRSAVSLAS